MSPFDRILTTVCGVIRSAEKGRLANEKFRAVVAWGEARSRARDYFKDGAWHSPAQIIAEFGFNTEKLVEDMLAEGHSFQVSGMGWRMVPRKDFNTPCCRGTIETIELMEPRLEATSVPIPNVVLDKVVKQEPEATIPKVPSPEGHNSADNVQPFPQAPLLPSSVAKVMPAGGPTAKAADAIGNGSLATARVAKPEERCAAGHLQPPTQVRSSPSSAVKAALPDAPTANTSDPLLRKDPATVAGSAGTATKTSPSAVPIRKPISKPSSVPVKQSSSMPLQATQTQSAPTQRENQIRSLAMSHIGGYLWRDSQRDADLMANGIVLRYQRKYLVVDVVRDRRTIAQVDVDIDRSGKFLQYFGVGFAQEVEHFGERAFKCDYITDCCLYGRGSYLVARQALLDVAPKIPSFEESLRLRKNLRWAMPRLTGKRTNDFAIRSARTNIDCLPIIVDIDRRKTSEPLVKVHFYARHNDAQGPNFEFCGEGYLSWFSAIVLAHWGHVGVKISLPKGGWTIAYLSSDVKVTPDGKEYARSLLLEVESLPALAWEWARRLPDIFHLPLSQEYTRPDLDWSNGFPPVPKKKTS